MPRPRRTQISLEDTPYYHCCSRVVRRAFLCGDDAYSGKNYDHRRGWVESLLFELEAVFAIDVAAFAIMSNHLHLVLHIDIEIANRWTDREVLEQWHKLFKGDELTRKFTQGELIEAYEVPRLKNTIAIYRSRLCDISWFMRCLNEPIARQANQEDNCTGRFWEGRFKSQGTIWTPNVNGAEVSPDYALFKHLTRRLLCRALAELKSALKIRLTTIVAAAWYGEPFCVVMMPTRARIMTTAVVGWNRYCLNWKLFLPLMWRHSPS